LKERVEVCGTAFAVIVCDMVGNHEEDLERELWERHDD
jgi:hypothetical protein